MARFWRGGAEKRENASTHSFRVFMRTLTTSGLFKGKGKVRGSEASLVNSRVSAECATQQSSAWGDGAYRPQLGTTYHSFKMQQTNYEWHTHVNKLLMTRKLEIATTISWLHIWKRQTRKERKSTKVTTMKTWAPEPSCCSPSHTNPLCPPKSNKMMTYMTFSRCPPHLSWCFPRVLGSDMWSVLWRMTKAHWGMEGGEP